MARTFDGVDNELRVTTAIVSAYPLTMALWARPNIDADDAILVIADTATDAEFWGLRLNTVANGLVFMSRSSGETDGDVFATGTYTVGAWLHACGTGASSTSRACYRDGANKGTNTTANTPDGLDNTSFGLLRRTATALIYDGDLCEGALWSADLTDGETLALGNGVHPCVIRRSSLAGYWPIYGAASPEPDWSGSGNNLTVTGTTITASSRSMPMLRQAVGWRGAAELAVKLAYQPWYHRAPVLAQ